MPSILWPSPGSDTQGGTGTRYREVGFDLRAETTYAMTEPKAFTAEELADLLSKDIFDAEDAARFLGIARNSIEYAAYRHRIPYVQYGAKKLFTRHDLLAYASDRGRGRDSRLVEQPAFVVKA